MALSLPPCLATILENSPGATWPVPLNIRCSRKCGRPDLPGGLSAVPTRYQTQCATTGARWFGTTTTCMPLSRVKVSGWNTPAGTGESLPPSVRVAPAASGEAAAAAAAGERSGSRIALLLFSGRQRLAARAHGHHTADLALRPEPLGFGHGIDDRLV